MDDLVLTTVAQRPEYATRLGEAAAHAWPHFMMQDLVAEVLLGQLVTAFPELQLIATTADRWPGPGRCRSPWPTGPRPAPCPATAGTRS